MHDGLEGELPFPEPAVGPGLGGAHAALGVEKRGHEVAHAPAVGALVVPLVLDGQVRAVAVLHDQEGRRDELLVELGLGRRAQRRGAAK